MWVSEWVLDGEHRDGRGYMGTWPVADSVLEDPKPELWVVQHYGLSFSGKIGN